MMDASFCLAVRYDITAQCSSPLRTGNADGEIAAVLLTNDGTPFIQGSSIAGALRDFLKQSFPKQKDIVDEMCGIESVGSELIVSDGLFEKGTESAVRPRLRIDPGTGSAADGGKFNVAHVAPQSKFHFHIILTARDRENSFELKTEMLEKALAAMNAGTVRLGAQQSNGFGEVRLSAKKRKFDMRKEEDRRAWLENAEGQPFELAAFSDGRYIRFTLCGHTDGMLVRSEETRVENSAEKRAEVTTFLKENGKAVIPGSSIKGAVRAQAVRIAPHIGLSDADIIRLFGCADVDGDRNGGQPGRLRFHDAYFADGMHEKKCTRIRINRFTGGVMDKALFSEDVTCGKMVVSVDVPEDEVQGCRLVAFVLRDLGLGLLPLGSGAGIGRGILKAEVLNIESPDGRKVKVSFGEDSRVTVSDDGQLLAEWQKAKEAEK